MHERKKKKTIQLKGIRSKISIIRQKNKLCISKEYVFIFRIIRHIDEGSMIKICKIVQFMNHKPIALPALLNTGKI